MFQNLDLLSASQGPLQSSPVGGSCLFLSPALPVSSRVKHTPLRCKDEIVTSCDPCNELWSVWLVIPCSVPTAVVLGYQISVSLVKYPLNLASKHLDPWTTVSVVICLSFRSFDTMLASRLLSKRILCCFRTFIPEDLFAPLEPAIEVVNPFSCLFKGHVVV